MRAGEVKRDPFLPGEAGDDKSELLTWSELLLIRAYTMGTLYDRKERHSATLAVAFPPSLHQVIGGFRPFGKLKLESSLQKSPRYNPSAFENEFGFCA